MEMHHRTIYQVLQARAEEAPYAIALVSPGREPITYRQLLIQIDAIIESLSAIGIGRHDRVAFVLPNGIETAVAFLGISCAAISVPLNPSYRENEVDIYLSDLSAKLLIVQAGVRTSAAPVARRRGIPVAELVSSAKDASMLFSLEASGPVSSAPQQTIEADDVALILHTSGTTAKPKRVLLSHNNLCTSAFSVRNTLALTREDRCLGVMPLFHIHGLIGGLLSSLAAGASFVATPNFAAECFIDWINEFKPTWYTAVPTIHQAVLSHARECIATVVMVPLRFIRSSSAPLPRSVMAQLEEVFKAPVIEAYGMTEASHQISSNRLPPAVRKVGSVGMPAGSDVAIMDRAGNLSEPGNIGEIVIRGANVTPGYEPEEFNKEAFVNGWLRTGDLGYLDSSGFLFLTGRLKEVINRGGENISPREIDEALLDHPDVLQAAAFAIPHPSLGEEIAAVIVVRDPVNTKEASIRDYLVGRLASFKVPARLLIVEDIPKSSTGKVQRAVLAGIFAGRMQGEFIPPKNDLEMLVASIFADVLEVRPVGATDNFFALGGDSLRAMQVISRVRSLFLVNLSIATLFAKVTVAELAREIAVSVEALDDSYKEAIYQEVREVSQADFQLYDSLSSGNDDSKDE
jgi:acyl-CoA synthetase (AMP-forming)/AMP-acid ligase II/acyl carrier protein